MSPLLSETTNKQLLHSLGFVGEQKRLEELQERTKALFQQANSSDCDKKQLNKEGLESLKKEFIHVFTKQAPSGKRKKQVVSSLLDEKKLQKVLSLITVEHLKEKQVVETLFTVNFTHKKYHPSWLQQECVLQKKATTGPSFAKEDSVYALIYQTLKEKGISSEAVKELSFAYQKSPESFSEVLFRCEQLLLRKDSNMEGKDYPPEEIKAILELYRKPLEERFLPQFLLSHLQGAYEKGIDTVIKHLQGEKETTSRKMLSAIFAKIYAKNVEEEMVVSFLKDLALASSLCLAELREEIEHHYQIFFPLEIKKLPLKGWVTETLLGYRQKIFYQLVGEYNQHVGNEMHTERLFNYKLANWGLFFGKGLFDDPWGKNVAKSELEEKMKSKYTPFLLAEHLCERMNKEKASMNRLFVQVFKEVLCQAKQEERVLELYEEQDYCLSAAVLLLCWFEIVVPIGSV